MTPNLDFKFMLIFNVKRLKNGARYAIGLATLTNQYKVICDLSIGAIFNDLERPRNPDFKVTPLFEAEYVINGRPSR